MNRILTFCLIAVLTSMPVEATRYYYVAETGVGMSWNVDDEIGFYTTSGTRIKHWAVETDETSTALFNGNGWSLAPNTEYYVYSPYSSYYFENDIPMTALPISLENQEQTDNNNLDHLSEVDYMMSSGKTLETSGDFAFRHLGCVLRISYKSEKARTFNKLTLKSKSDVFTVNAVMNMKEQQCHSTEITDCVSLNLSDVTVGEGETLVAYMMLFPINNAFDDIVCSLEAVDETLDLATLSGSGLRAGKMYNICLTPEETTYSVSSEIKETQNMISTLEKPSCVVPMFERETKEPIAVHLSEKNPSTKIDGIASYAKESVYQANGVRAVEAYQKGILICNGKKVVR